MARGLFLAFPGHGHVNPTIGLVNELIRKGDEIIYICSEEFRSKFENTGAKFIGFDLDLSDFDGKNTINNMGERFLKIFKNILSLLKMNLIFSLIMLGGEILIIENE